MLFSAQLSFASWKLVHEEEGIKVFSGSFQKSGVIPFKAIGVVNAPISKVSETIEDDKLKPQWSPKLKDVVVHEKLNRDHIIFSEYYSTPWPAVDREFLIEGKILRHSESEVQYVGTSYKGQYADSDHIQADVKKLNFTLKEISENRTQVVFEFNGDMKGWMPIWLMNLIQKKWPLRFIQGLRKQIEL